MDDILQPDASGPVRLLTALADFFATLDAVLCVAVFGSLARGEGDRWSDVDLIVVTADRGRFRAVFDALCRITPVVYHGPFTPQVDPAGGRVLGIMFADESVFHSLDLNFFTANEYRTEGVLRRFGLTQELYRQQGEWTGMGDSGADDLIAETESPAERQITTAQHFTKKFAKRVLRGGGDLDAVRTWAARLEAALHDAEGQPLRAGVDVLARGYFEVAQALTAGRHTQNEPHTLS